MALDESSAKDGAKPTHGVIELRLRELNQLFNSMDPSPFREKDLDDDAVEFIVSWAREFPADKPLSLVIHMENSQVGPEVTKMVTDSIHLFFNHRSELADKRLHQLLRVGRTSLVVGIGFLSACLLLGAWLQQVLGEKKLASIAGEGFEIVGWVAMWRPLEIFLYEWWPIRNERRAYDRLGEMSVKIICAKQERPPGEDAVSATPASIAPTRSP